MSTQSYYLLVSLIDCQKEVPSEYVYRKELLKTCLNKIETLFLNIQLLSL